jgi:hypothetical protein
MSIDTLIEEKDLSLVALSLELEKATIDCDLRDEHSIYVHEEGMFPFWINLHEGPRFLLLTTYLEWVPEVPDEERLAFCNRINEQLFMPAVYLRTIERDDGETIKRFTAAYPISYRDGLLISQFIRLCRKFASAMTQIQNDFDPEHAMLQPL